MIGIKIYLTFILLLSVSFLAEIDEYNGVGEEFGAGPSSTSQRGLGQYGYPNDPMIDRAKGLLLKGKVKTAVTNYGDFINWYIDPAGLWGEYSYLPDLAMIAGVAGHRYSSKFTWDYLDDQDMQSICNANGNQNWCNQYLDDIDIWCSEDLYDDWNLNPEDLFLNDHIAENDNDPSSDVHKRVNGEYIGIVFETEDDRGIVGTRKKDTDEGPSILNIDAHNQWVFDYTQSESGDSRVCISIRDEGANASSIDPNQADAMIGVMYPWGLRPSLKRREAEFDLYEYGQDGEDWTQDDEYSYYGATAQESWFTRWNPSTNSDWHATTRSRETTHGQDYVAADLFADTFFSDSQDDWPLLAHSAYSQTWPEKFTDDGETIKYWPGWYSQGFNPDLPFPCDGDRKNDACWEEVPMDT